MTSIRPLRAKRRVPLRRKLLGLAIGTVGSLVTFEAVLWVLHAALGVEGRAPAEIAPRPGERRILCIGDSNTYGIYIGPNESYPGRLQEYLDRAPGNPWRVINLGYPGQNTAQMRARLAENLDAYRPEIVVLWGGINNSWSPAMGYLWEHPDGEPRDPDRGLLERSRAYGALRMMFLEGRLMATEGEGRRYEKAVDIGASAVPGLDGAQRGEGLGDVETADPETDRVPFRAEEIRHGIRTDLRRIHALCDERGVALFFGEYWAALAWVDASVNTAVEEAAAELDVPVLPLRERMRALVAEYGEARLLSADHHASAVGNREVARLVLGALIDAGLLERRAEWAEVPAIEEVLDHPTLTYVSQDGPVVAVEVIAPPDWRYIVRALALVRAGADGPVETVVLTPELAERMGIAMPDGRIGRFGATNARVVFPEELASALPERAGAPIVGWRLRATVKDPEDGAGGWLESNAVDVDPSARGTAQ